jgi:hypothetical protein
MTIARTSLSVLICMTLAVPAVAFAAPPPPPPPGGGGVAAQTEQPPDPSSVSPEERISWAKKLFKEAKEAHDREDFYNSVVKFEQAYSFAPDKHIFAFNIGQDAWELKDCARVKQYLEMFLVKENNNADLRKKAQELLAKAENNPACLTGGPAAGGGDKPGTGEKPPPGPATDPENPLAGTGSGTSDPTTGTETRKRGASGLLIGGVVLAVLGVGAVGGGIGTLAVAHRKVGEIEDAAAPGGFIGTFPQGQYNDDVADDFAGLKTLNTVTPILLATGGALLVGGVAMIAVDRINKKKGTGFHAGDRTVEVVGFGAAPMRGGASVSLALRF